MCKPGSMKAHDNVKAQVYVLKKDEGGWARPFTSFIQLQMFSKTWDCTAQVRSREEGLGLPDCYGAFYFS